MAKGQILFFLPAIFGLLLAGSSELEYGGVQSGNATYYTMADGTGNCSFDALPEPQYVGALNNIDYNTPEIDGIRYPNATLCGAYARVTGRKGTVTIKIVDRCPDAICTKGHIDLSPEAFAAVDDLIHGYVPITWQLISPPIAGPISFRYKDGSSQWWTAIQVLNHRNPVAKLEFLQDGSWNELERMQYNYFIASSGLGVGYHTFRVTDIFGNRIEETSTVYLDGHRPDKVSWQGQGQFPAPR
jgi:expansin (peptidoglycan-binding protein)